MDEDNVSYLISEEIEPLKRNFSSLHSQTQDLDDDLDTANRKITKLEKEVNELKGIFQILLDRTAPKTS
jgi:peptidoglycan hydrolase CwlO-like protein